MGVNMGSDGGLRWVRLRNPFIFKQLIDGLRLYNTHSTRGSKIGDASRSDYLNKYPELKGNSYFVTSYGTDVNMVSLRDIIAESQYSDSFFEAPDLTFIEIVMSKATEPWGGHVDSIIYSHLRAKYGWQYGWSRCREMQQEWLDQMAGHPVLSMVYRDWGAAMLAVIDDRSYGSAETWT